MAKSLNCTSSALVVGADCLKYSGSILRMDTNLKVEIFSVCIPNCKLYALLKESQRKQKWKKKRYINFMNECSFDY